MLTLIAAVIIFIVGFLIGYLYHANKAPTSSRSTPTPKSIAATHQQRLNLKAQHQSDSDRIRELNRLSSNQSIFYRLLQNTFIDFPISVKNNRFIVLDHDHFPIAIFEYRDGTAPLKLIDQEDGLPLHLYKALISTDELTADLHRLLSQQTATTAEKDCNFKAISR